MYAKRHESKVRYVDSKFPPDSSSIAIEIAEKDSDDAVAAGVVVEGTVSFLTGRQNHLFTQIKRFAQLNHMPLREVLESVEEYFQQQRSTLVRTSDKSHIHSNIVAFSETEVDISPESEDPFADLVPLYGFNEIKHVFFDTTLQLYIEIDPLEQVCCRVIPFPSAIIPTMPEVLRVIERQFGGLHGGPLGHVRFLLQQEIAHYVQLCFGTIETAISVEKSSGVGEKNETSQLMGSARMLMHNNNNNNNDSNNNNNNNNSDSGFHRGASACAGSFVAVQQQRSRSGNSRNTNTTSSEKNNEKEEKGEKGNRSIVIAMSAVRYFPRNMWSGRWKSIFIVECIKNASEESQVYIRGETQIYAHYYEDGNMHIEIARELEPTPLPQWPAEIFTTSNTTLVHDDNNDDNINNTTDGWELTATVMNVLKRHEESVQDAVLRAARDVDDRVLQKLRRRLPITQQLFDFRRTPAIPRSLLTRSEYNDEL
ncbi:hypothetical protein LSM04_000560 [Trypanosoma melophagium]|nr:hypothetical protein LSM04_000560 [Trypanosoma melophagium]